MKQETKDAIISFRDERDWRRFHNPKDLAISLSLEAAELLENFQWSSYEEAMDKNRCNIEDELADIIIYTVLFADVIGADIDEIVGAKIRRNADKYPVEKSKGRKEKYDKL